MYKQGLPKNEYIKGRNFKDIYGKKQVTDREEKKRRKTQNKKKYKNENWTGTHRIQSQSKI